MTTLAAAFFDLDKTLSIENLSFAFGKFLYRRSFFSFRAMIYLAQTYSLHKLGLLNLKAVHDKSFARIFLGADFPFVQELMEEFLTEKEGFLWRPSILSELQKLQSLGIETILLSSSPSFVVEPAAKRLGFSAFASTLYGKDRVEYLLTGEEKARFVQEFATQKSLKSIHFQAFSDSVLDLPFLESVGVPVAVFPDKKLLKIARERGWKIIAS